jgi:hypothetical protein
VAKGKKSRRSKRTTETIVVTDDDGDLEVDDPIAVEPPKGRNKRGSKKAILKSPQAGEKRPPTSPAKSTTAVPPPGTPTGPTKPKRARKARDDPLSPSKDKGSKKTGKVKKGKEPEELIEIDESDLVHATGSMAVADPIPAPFFDVSGSRPVDNMIAQFPSGPSAPTSLHTDIDDPILQALMQPGGQADPFEDDLAALHSLHSATVRSSSPLTDISEFTDIRMASPRTLQISHGSTINMSATAPSVTQGPSNSGVRAPPGQSRGGPAHGGSLAANRDGSGSGMRGRRHRARR